jgi:PLP dependent protein
MADIQRLQEIKSELLSYNATLIAVSKTKSAEEIKEVYDAGHKIFGENYTNELNDKKIFLPADIEWHFIGHLQSKKAKEIVNSTALIHGVDSEKLLSEINKQGDKLNRKINCLLQIYIAQEETKFGFDFTEAVLALQKSSTLPFVKIHGLMGMATNTDDEHVIEKEFQSLYKFFSGLQKEYSLTTLSMGMSSDYKIALNCGSNMVRIGSAIFGERNMKF